MSEPKGEIDLRSNYDVRYQAMTMAIEALGRDRRGYELIEIAIAIEGYLLGDNSRLAPAAPEQPSYKHPEKDIFNPSEDDGWDVAAEADEDLPTAEDVCGILAEDSTETMLSDSFPNAAGGVTERKVFKDGSASIKSTDAAGGSVTLKSDPITPMADLSANQVHKDELRSFAGFDVSEMDLTEGVLAEAVSANGEKVVITE